MATATLSIDLGAVRANWRALDRQSAAGVETAAVVKADGYGLGSGRIAKTLAGEGVQSFFVAVAEEGRRVRDAVGPGPDVFVFSGHMAGDGEMLAASGLTPLLNSPEQWHRHRALMPGQAFGVQLDTGMNRLGMEPTEWAALCGEIRAAGPKLVMSHLACADDPDHAMNRAQLAAFRAMTDGMGLRRSLAATGGILLGPQYHFDLTRPGVGLYGGQPFAAAAPVLRLAIPVVQLREVEPGEIVGYSATWTAEKPTRIATLAAGYADGLIRAMGAKAVLFADAVPCPLAGRVSMDLLTVDVSHLDEIPQALDILGPYQGVDDLADAAGTIGYEILTSLGARYNRVYTGG